MEFDEFVKKLCQIVDVEAILGNENPDDDYFVCPECDKPIYRCDYEEHFNTNIESLICPVCEQEFHL